MSASAADLAPDASGGRARKGSPLRIERIGVTGGAHPAVRIDMDGNAAPTAHTLPASGGLPDRIYVDIPDATPDVARLVKGTGPVLRVRAAPRPEGGSRVVIEVKPRTSFALRSDGGSVVVAMQGDAPRMPPARPEATRRQEKARPVAVPKVAAKPATAKLARGRRGQTGATLLVAALNPAPAPEAEHGPAEPLGPVLTPPLDANGENLEVGLTPAAVRPPLALPEAPAPVVEPARAPAPDGPVEPTTLAAGVLTSVHGARYVWPDVRAPWYAGADTEVQRDLLANWRRGLEPKSRPPEPTTPAMRYLQVDLEFLRVTARARDGEGLLGALRSYEQVVRVAPAFPDAPRAALMVALVYLQLDFAPEAHAAFRQMARTYPASPLVGYARLGEVSALRLMRRLEEARRALDAVRAGAQGDLVCQARLEEAELARAGGDAAQAVTLLHALTTDCPGVLAMPGVLRGYADALAAAGDVAGARTLLAMPRESGGDEEDAQLELFAGRLAAVAGDTDAARGAFGRALRMDPSESTRMEIRMQLARLGGDYDPAASVGALLRIAEGEGTIAQRATALGEAADASARAGKYAAAMALLDRATDLGPEGQAQADGRRTEILGRWIAKLTAAGDVVGVVAVYAAHATAVHELATPEDGIAVSRALQRLGLPESAAQLLVQRPSEPRADVDTARAEAELAAGDAAAARATATRALAAPGLAPEVATRARAALARAAVAAGDPARALAALGGDGDAAVRAEVARTLAAHPATAEHASALVEPIVAGTLTASADTLVLAGQAADAAGAAALAERAYGAALRGGVKGPLRAQAGAGIARLALARGDRRTAAEGLTVVAASGDRFVQRAATAAARALELESEEDGDAR
ncbi:MAG: hypothetical protein U0807_00605 [Candidatus Binatia bacterium]